MVMRDDQLDEAAAAEAYMIDMAKAEAIRAVSTPNYYAIVPANVRYDKNLSYLEKILYAELTALSNRMGYCFASNEYFCTNFGNSVRTIQRAIAHLEEMAYIAVRFVKVPGLGDGQTGLERRIYIVKVSPDVMGGYDKNDTHDKNDMGGMTKMSPKPEAKQPENGIDAIFIEDSSAPNSMKDNSITITNTTKEEYLAVMPDQAKPGMATKGVPPWLGPTGYARMAKLYELMFNYKFEVRKTIMASSPESAAIKALLKQYSEPFTALLIIVHFEWKGVNADDERINRRIENAGYPLTWIPKNAPLYIAFIRSKLGIKTNDEAVEHLQAALLKITTP